MTKTLLVVDDDPAVRDLVSELAIRRGYAVESAADGAEALRVLASRTIDVIVSDVNMPVMDGLTFHARVHAGPWKTIPFFFLTGAMTSDIEEYVARFPEVTLLTKDHLPRNLPGVLTIAGASQEL
jgi:CheY-like chemotaxis protein